MADTQLPLYRSHSRSFHSNKFVYPVLSRRSKGISVGLNLNPDKVCNFDCIYCQVDRRSEAETKFVETDRLLAELDSMLEMIVAGELYHDEQFARVLEPLRRLNDLAFSGDGEPTTYRNFDEIVAEVACLKQRHGLHEAKMVLITNASMFHRPPVERALEILDANQGEIWAKLDAGTEAYYQLVDRTKIPFRRILDNITAAARVRPLVIQSLFMCIDGVPPDAAEIDAYCDRLTEIVAAEGRIQLVQVYTVARRPAESYVTALAPGAVDGIAAKVHERTGLPTDVYYGS
jgi:wyosine [tRNA(Phe)-imidazoG37] synthetase (radical SAM superfamily)